MYSETELYIQTQELGEGKSVSRVHHVPEKHKVSPKLTLAGVDFSIIISCIRKQNWTFSLTCPESHWTFSDLSRVTQVQAESETDTVGF